MNKFETFNEAQEKNPFESNNKHGYEEEIPNTVDDFEDNWQKQKDHILDNFKEWLDELDELPLNEPTSTPEVGLLDLFGEFSALRQEIKLQSKTNQSIAGQLNKFSGDLHEKLDRSHDFTAAINDLKGQIPQARQEARQEVLLELLPIIEGLERTLETLKKNSLPTFLFGAAKEKQQQNFIQPINILQSKAADSLARLDVESVANLGSSFDANTMRAVGTTKKSGREPGQISEILRQGYTLRGHILQTAEVKVEK